MQIAEVKADIAQLDAKTEKQIAGVKADIAQLDAKLEKRIAEVKADIAQLDARTEKRIAEVKAEIARLETLIAGRETRLLRWMAATVGAGVAFLSLLIALLEVFR